MDLSDWANIGSIVQSIFVVISVLFIWYELHQNRKLTRASNVRALVELSSPFNMQLIQDPEMAKLWYEGAMKFDEMALVDQYRYTELVSWWMILHENIYYQHSKGLIDDEVYGSWNRDLEKFVGNKGFDKHWYAMHDSYQPEFAKHLSRMILDSLN